MCSSIISWNHLWYTLPSSLSALLSFFYECHNKWWVWVCSIAPLILNMDQRSSKLSIRQDSSLTILQLNSGHDRRFGWINFAETSICWRSKQFSPVSSVIRQKGESQNGCFVKTKHVTFSEKRTFITPWCAHVPILNNCEGKGLFFSCEFSFVENLWSYLNLYLFLKFKSLKTSKTVMLHVDPLNITKTHWLKLKLF